MINFSPGHEIEAGWFLLRYAVQTSNNSLKETALMSLIEQPFQKGWDKENGGLFYFLDANGLSPMQLEWNMKLWWPTCESMIAFLMAYKYTEKYHYLHTFATIFDHAITHVSILLFQTNFENICLENCCGYVTFARK